MTAGEIPPDLPEFKGCVIIEWPAASGHGPLCGWLAAVYDSADGGLIPAHRVTVHATADGAITADVAVYLGRDGEILRDPMRIGRESDGVPATFPFLVAEMRVK